MDEPCCEPIFRKIGELGMMTVIHGGRSIRTKEFPVLPRAVARYIDCFQGAPVVLSAACSCLKMKLGRRQASL